MSDGEFVRMVLGRIEALYLAHRDFAQANQARPRSRKARAEVDVRFPQLLDCVSARLDRLAVEHLGTAPGQWGPQFTADVTIWRGRMCHIANHQAVVASIPPVLMLLTPWRTIWSTAARPSNCPRKSATS
jgi:hypothetical protein